MFWRVILSSVLFSCYTSSLPAEVPGRYLIEEVSFEVVGNNTHGGAAASIAATKMKTKKGFYYSSEQLDTDLKGILQDFDWVEHEVIFTDEGTVRLHVKLWERKTIRSITFVGNHSFSDTALLEEMEVSPCRPYQAAEFCRSFQKLQNFYVKNGFFDTTFDYVIHETSDSPYVDITVHICEGGSGKIKQIYFCGFEKCEVDDLLSLMVSKRWDVVSYLMADQGMFNEEAIKYDEWQVTNYLQNRGYADAKVSIRPIPDCKEGRVNLFVEACRGQQYHFGQVSFGGNCCISSEDIECLVKMRGGDLFSPDAIRDTIKDITDIYGGKGYIEAYVDETVSLHEECPIYDVHFSIDEGEQYRVGLVKIFGNTCTHPEVILHEILLSPGDTLNMLRLRLSEERLRAVGYFKCVNIYPVRSEVFSGCENYRDIHIEVEETATGNLGAFLGFSNGEDLFGGINLSEKNFNLRGIRRKAFNCWGWKGLKGGGEYLSFNATFGQKLTSYEMSWTKPHFQETPWSIGFDAKRTYNRAISDDFDAISSTFKVVAGRQVNAFVRFAGHYRITDALTKASNKLVSALPNGETPKQPVGPGEESGTKEINRADGIVSALGFSLIYDSTNSLMRPSRGVRSSFDMEFAGLGGQFSFFSFAYLNSFYYPICKDGVLRYRADAKFIFPQYSTKYQDLPMEERLFLGGDWVVRGFRPYAIGPKLIGTTQPSGGLSLVLLSAEYDHVIASRASLFLFADAGSLSDRQWYVGSLKASIGYGAKVKLLDGAPPLVVGMGYPLNAQNRSDVKRFFISMGARF